MIEGEQICSQQQRQGRKEEGKEGLKEGRREGKTEGRRLGLGKMSCPECEMSPIVFKHIFTLCSCSHAFPTMMGYVPSIYEPKQCAQP